MDPLIDAPPGGASPLLTTARLRLHTWSDEDREGLYRLSTDPVRPALHPVSYFAVPVTALQEQGESADAADAPADSAVA